MPSTSRLLPLLVFVSGFVVMGLEMSASRLLAPYFGTSLYVWAVLIGLMLVYLSVGYVLGGRLADRYPRADVLYRLVALAGFCVALIPLVSGPILRWSVVGFDTLSIGIFAGALVAVLALFAVPVLALGCVSPYAIRLRLDSVRDAGQTSGGLYALSTIGSLTGTFVTVFVLIPTIGTRRSLLALSLALTVTAVLGLMRLRRRYLLYALLLVPALVQLFVPARPVRAAEGGRLIYQTESAYYYIQVVQAGTTRELVLDEGQAIHSVYDPTRLLTGAYWDDFLLAPLFSDRYVPHHAPRVAILGLGGGTVARLYAATYPGAHLDGVELDPAIVSVARRYFDLHEPRLRVFTEDARYFLLTHPQRRYGVITVDAFQQPYIPFQLTTREFFQVVRQRLRPGGVVAINVGHTATDYRLVNALASTMRAVFPSVFVVDVPGTINSVVFASKGYTSRETFLSNLHRTGGMVRMVGDRALQHLRLGPRHGPIFTDDLAPVEQLVDQIILDYAQRG